jgi:uncharacterized membrane protein
MRESSTALKIYGVIGLIVAVIFAIMAIVQSPSVSGVKCGNNTMNPGDPQQVCAPGGLIGPNDRGYAEQEQLDQDRANANWWIVGIAILLSILCFAVSGGSSQKNAPSPQPPRTVPRTRISQDESRILKAIQEQALKDKENQRNDLKE